MNDLCTVHVTLKYTGTTVLGKTSAKTKNEKVKWLRITVKPYVETRIHKQPTYKHYFDRELHSNPTNFDNEEPLLGQGAPAAP